MTPPARSVRSFRMLLVAPIAMAGAACAGVEAGSGSVARDSAGIRIVENDHRRPAWTPETAWRLTAEPRVRIGDVSGDSAYLLYQVPHVRRLHDGRIAVVNTSSRQVRLYDDRGAYLGAIGGAGEGPGEFRGPWAVHELAGDSLVVVDLYREVSIFDRSGRFVRRFLPPRPSEQQLGEGFEPEGRFGDGSLLFKSHYPEDHQSTGVLRSRIAMIRVGLDGSTTRSLGDFDDQTYLKGGMPQYLFGPWAHEAAAERTMWYGSGDGFELREIDFEGNTVRIVRLDRPLRPVTEDDVQAFLDDILRRVEGTGREQITRRLFADAQHPEYFPAHFALKVDAEDNLWVQDYQPFRLPVERVWSVFDPEGRYLGDVTVPAGLTVHDIGADYLLGVYRDELDVEYVDLYGLEKARE